MESFGQKKVSNSMHGLKSAIMAIFQKSANWLDWSWPVSAALQSPKPPTGSFFLFQHMYAIPLYYCDNFVLTRRNFLRFSTPARPWGIGQPILLLKVS